MSDGYLIETYPHAPKCRSGRSNSGKRPTELCLLRGCCVTGTAPCRPPAGLSGQAHGTDPPVGICVIRPSDTNFN